MRVSGEITVNELKAMFFGSAITGETGIEMDELQARRDSAHGHSQTIDLTPALLICFVQEYFEEADFDDSDAINLAEFEKLMVSTGLYTPETLPPDVTPEQLVMLEDEKHKAKAAEKIQARYRGNVSRQKTAERFSLKREDTSRFYQSGRRSSMR